MKKIPVYAKDRATILGFLRRQLIRLTAPRAVRQIWKPAGKKKIRICDMDDGHLLNTIGYVLRSARRMEFLPALKQEATRRGLRADGSVPTWLAKHNHKFRDRAERKRTAALEALDMYSHPWNQF